MRLLFLTLIFISCLNNEEDMKKIMQSLPSEIKEVEQPTIAETEQEIFGIQTPDINHSAYRMAGLCITNNKVVIATSTAFYGTSNADGLPSDVLMYRSTDLMKTWQDSQVIGNNNGVIPESRAYNSSLVVDRSINRVWNIFVTIDDPANLTSIIPPVAHGTYVYDVKVNYSDNDGLTWSSQVSIKSALDAKDPNTFLLILGGPGNGIQTNNGNLIFTGYVGTYFSVNNYQWHPMTIYSTDKGVNWVAGEQNIVHATETNGFELSNNIILMNSRDTPNRKVYDSNDNGETYSANPANNLIPGVSVFGGTEKIPANGTTRLNNYYLFSLPLSSVNRDNITLYGSLDYINWTSLKILEVPNSRGYSNMVYYDGMIACVYESSTESTNNKLTLKALNLSKKIDYYYNALLI